MSSSPTQSVSQLNEWIGKAKEGEEGFRHIYQYYLQRIYNYVLQRVNHIEIAEDLVSDIFFAVADSFKDFRGDGHVLTGWIYKIAHNRVKNYYREKSRKFSLVFDEDILINHEDTSAPFVDDLAKNNEVTFIKKALQFLPAEEAELITLRYFEGLDRKQLAILFATREGTIATRISRAVQKLRVLVQTMLKEDSYATE